MYLLSRNDADVYINRVKKAKHVFHKTKNALPATVSINSVMLRHKQCNIYTSSCEQIQLSYILKLFLLSFCLEMSVRVSVVFSTFFKA